ncbi:hypothetical protein TNCV_1769081 [Trichonephila clavipes]|nr:hypothetical protein TNCV_1769081 [Trichonephila clavipes]
MTFPDSTDLTCVHTTSLQRHQSSNLRIDYADQEFGTQAWRCSDLMSDSVFELSASHRLKGFWYLKSSKKPLFSRS